MTFYLNFTLVSFRTLRDSRKINPGPYHIGDNKFFWAHDVVDSRLIYITYILFIIFSTNIWLDLLYNNQHAKLYLGFMGHIE